MNELMNGQMDGQTPLVVTLESAQIAEANSVLILSIPVQ